MTTETRPTQQSIVQELDDLIAELEAVRDGIRDEEFGMVDFSGFADDLSCQTGTISTIMQHIDQLNGER